MINVYAVMAHAMPEQLAALIDRLLPPAARTGWCCISMRAAPCGAISANVFPAIPADG
jgi:hypothetical protein